MDAYGLQRQLTTHIISWFLLKGDTRMAEKQGIPLTSKEIGVCKEHIWPYNPQFVEGNEGQGPPRRRPISYHPVSWLTRKIGGCPAPDLSRWPANSVYRTRLHLLVD